ncbi:unnamed protein product [Ectocarpus fasciculatus]
MATVEEKVDQAIAEGLGEEALAEKFEQHGEAFNGFLGDVQANVLSQLNAHSVGPEGFVENFEAFRSAVDWTEPWIQGILVFHLLLWLFFIVTRRSFGAQVGLFAVILTGTRLSEFINTCLRDRWQDFSRQNYFDEHGIFMGVMWAGPLLILGFTMLVSLLCQTASLLVTVKTKQFKREIAAKKDGGKSKAKRGAKDKKASKQA